MADATITDVDLFDGKANRHLQWLKQSASPHHVDVREVMQDQASELASLTEAQLVVIATMLEFNWNRGYKKGYSACMDDED